MKLRIDTQNLFRRTSLGLAGLLVTAAGAAAANAQDWSDWEWEADEGYHEQEWYDPSDWFDADRGGVDYEYDDYDYDAYYDEDDWFYGDGGFDDDWYEEDDAWWDEGYEDDYGFGYDEYGWYNEGVEDDYGYGIDADLDRGYDEFGYYDYEYYDDYYSAYYDAYYDGYYDDEFGYDYGVGGDDASGYAKGYVEGYYDGFYDQENVYTYDPFYYVDADAHTARRQQDGRQRAQDSRQRGDRTRALARQQGADLQALQRAQREHYTSGRIRGTIESVEILRGARPGDDEPAIARIRTEDGRTATINLGPRMTRQRIPFSEGDRVTVFGTRQRNGDRSMLKAHSLTVGGETVRLRERDAQRDQRSTRAQRDRMRRDQMQREQRRMQDRRTAARDDRQWQRQRADNRQAQRGQTQRNEAQRDQAQRNQNRRDQAQRDRQTQQGEQQARQGDQQARGVDRWQQASGRTASVEGTVDGVNRVTVGPDRFTIARVRMNDGTTRLVGIKESKLPSLVELDMVTGDRVTARGDIRRLSDRPVLMVNNLKISGEEVFSESS